MLFAEFSEPFFALTFCVKCRKTTFRITSDLHHSAKRGACDVQISPFHEGTFINYLKIDKKWLRLVKLTGQGVTRSENWGSEIGRSGRGLANSKQWLREVTMGEVKVAICL